MASADMLELERPTAPELPVARGVGEVSVTTWHRLSDAEGAWRSLTAGTVELPGQDFGFIRLWVDALDVPSADQFYVAAFENGTPIALLPLHRRRSFGMRVLLWFPGSHVGCNAPLIDGPKLAAMTPRARRALWRKMLAGIGGADLVYLKSVPKLVVDGVEVFAELGQMLAAGMLYRAAFVSFDEADRMQRNKSRRKHDRQQGDKLAAMGSIEFDELDNGLEALKVLDVMFRQRAARFRDMGVFDPFAPPAIRKFYDSTVAIGSGVRTRIHVLKLKGEVVAVRYNILHGDRLFCLISSMSEDPVLRPGSPGKQCLLRVMQTVFAEGGRVFDMGEGLTDEKRHWCNVLIPVQHHYLPITAGGAFGAGAHRGAQMIRAGIKSSPRLLSLAKALRGTLLHLLGKSAKPEAPAADVDAD